LQFIGDYLAATIFSYQSLRDQPAAAGPLWGPIDAATRDFMLAKSRVVQARIECRIQISRKLDRNLQASRGKMALTSIAFSVQIGLHIVGI